MRNVMKRIKRPIQRQQYDKPQQPFFIPESSRVQRAEERPFLQRQAKTEENEEQVQTIHKAEEEEKNETVQAAADAGEEREWPEVMRQTETEDRNNRKAVKISRFFERSHDVLRKKRPGHRPVPQIPGRHAPTTVTRVL